MLIEAKTAQEVLLPTPTPASSLPSAAHTHHRRRCTGVVMDAVNESTGLLDAKLLRKNRSQEQEQEQQQEQQQKHLQDPYRICIFVEPSPFTYVSGYANRYKSLLQHLRTVHDASQAEGESDSAAQPISNAVAAVTIVTVESTMAEDERPQSAFGFPIRYARGFTLCCYKTMSISCDWTFMAIRTVRQASPNLIHCSSPGFLVFPAIFCSKYYDIPLVLSYHTHIPVYVRSYLPSWLRWLSAILEYLIWTYLWLIHFCCADLTLVTSPQLAEEFRTCCGKFSSTTLQVWKKGIDTIKFHPSHRTADMRQRLTSASPLPVSLSLRLAATTGKDGDIFATDPEKPQEEIVLLYVGRLATEKRVHELKDIMDRLLERMEVRNAASPNVSMNSNTNETSSSTTQKAANARIHLAFVGSGPQEAQLHELFHDLINQTIVTFVGQLHKDQLSQAYASADIFVFPSDSETLGFVIMEAMASRLPVVAANAGGIPSMVTHQETGYLIDPGNLEGYVDALMELITDATLRQRMGSRGRELTESWSWQASMGELLERQYPMATATHFEPRRCWAKRRT